jgi:5'-methylthioadenosine phosphorylase
MSAAPLADVGVIGGSGLYSFLENVTELEIETPYGATSGPVVIGAIGERSVAFLPRHGAGHALPPHRIPYRANVWALHQVGVRQVLAPCAVGSLRADTPPGSVVVPDQLVDRTFGRAQTFYDSGAVHVGFADPYCPAARQVVLSVAQSRGEPCREGGTMVVI